MLKVLRIADFRKAHEIIKDADIFNNISSYVSPYTSSAELTEMIIKRNIFNYNKVFMEKNNNIISFKSCKNPSIENRIYLDLITNIDDENLEEFMSLAIKEAKLRYKKKTGVSIHIKSEKNSNPFNDLLIKLGFEQELILINELGEGNDVILLTKYI